MKKLKEKEGEEAVQEESLVGLQKQKEERRRRKWEKKMERFLFCKRKSNLGLNCSETNYPNDSFESISA